jgi:hypothetical protein
VILLSEAGQKNIFFIKSDVAQNTRKDVDVSVSSTTIATTTSTSSNSSDVEATNNTSVPGLITVSFEGLGYGQLKAQVPPQEVLDINTLLYFRTEQGLVPVARVSYTEKDSGSTFTNIYAQLLVAPFELYKVRIANTE